MKINIYTILALAIVGYVVYKKANKKADEIIGKETNLPVGTTPPYNHTVASNQG
jgi:hypothetical protein